MNTDQVSTWLAASNSNQIQSVNQYQYSSWGYTPSGQWFMTPTAGKETPPMRGLFEIFVVDPETDKVSGPYHVVAADESKARLKALAKNELGIDFDSVDVLCRRIGDVRAKKVVQEVKVVGE